MQLKLECYIHAEVINAVLKSLKKIKAKKIILDPVMVTTSKVKLLMKKLLIK